MDSQELLRRLGPGRDPADSRLSWALVLAVLLLYTAGFCLFYPKGPANDDEARYIRQAELLLEGASTVSKIDPLTGEPTEFRPSPYQPGTAALLSPFVWVAGRRAAYVGALLCLVLGTLITARWLQEERRSPIFALLIMGFPAALVLGRVTMSGSVSIPVVAGVLWLFWRGLDGRWPSWLASGFLAGASLLLRESNALIFGPFFAGALLRGDRHTWALIVGGLAGVGARLLGSYLTFGDPLHYKNPMAWGLFAVGENWELHVPGLLLLVPGGLILGLAYRGRRWPELVITLVFFAGFYLSHSDGSEASGSLKRIVISLRYYVPLLPLFSFAMAESVPRFWQRLLAARTPARRALLSEIAAGLLVVWLAGVATASFAVHWAFDRWNARQSSIRSAIAQYAAGDAILVSNGTATKKFIQELDRRHLALNRRYLTARDMAGLVERYEEVTIAFLDRSDSAYWRRDALANAEFIATLKPAPELRLDRQVTPTDRLRIWRVTEVIP